MLELVDRWFLSNHDVTRPSIKQVVIILMEAYPLVIFNYMERGVI